MKSNCESSKGKLARLLLVLQPIQGLSDSLLPEETSVAVSAA